jgi:hypothetical protein
MRQHHLTSALTNPPQCSIEARTEAHKPIGTELPSIAPSALSLTPGVRNVLAPPLSPNPAASSANFTFLPRFKIQ